MMLTKININIYRHLWEINVFYSTKIIIKLYDSQKSSPLALYPKTSHVVEKRPMSINVFQKKT